MIHPPTKLIEELKTIVDTNQFDHDIELINGYAGIAPISVQPELYTLIIRSLRLKELTGGVFDIFSTTSSIDHPIETNPFLLSIYLPYSGMKISLGPIHDLDIN